MPVYQIIFAAATFLCFAALIVLYLRSTRDLLNLVQRDPDLWQSLGKPQVIQMDDGLLSSYFTIEPIIPWLSWLLAGKTPGRDRKLTSRYLTTRRLFIACMISFLLTMGAFLLLFLTVPPDR